MSNFGKGRKTSLSIASNKNTNRTLQLFLTLIKILLFFIKTVNKTCYLLEYKWESLFYVAEKSISVLTVTIIMKTDAISYVNIEFTFSNNNFNCICYVVCRQLLLCLFIL